jgi:uncharacterized protein (DUF1800 family)
VSRFPDVPASHPFAADIDWLVTRGITQGFPDGSFRPAAPVTRGQMAAFLHRFKGSPATSAPQRASFVDVPDGHSFFREIEWLAGARITVGSSSPAGQVFRPAEPVARGQMAAFLHRFSGAPAFSPPPRPSFVDVPTGHSFFREIEWLASRGVTRGTVGSDGAVRFDPQGAVSRGAMAAFLHRMDAPAPPPAPPMDGVALHHLLRRASYGATPGLLADVAAAGGGAGWLEQQLDPAAVDDAACEAALSAFPLLTATPPEVDRRIERFGWDAMFQLQAATIARATLSRRQLLEVMVEFWSNHLNVTCPSSEVWATRAWHDRHVVRPHALGRFEDMLVATTTSPAMLRYLDGASSRGSQPNENWGRELLELHTVGRESGYTQADVLGAARALTGLSCWDPWNGGTADNLWTFRYRPEWHATGPVSVLGWSHPNSSAQDGIAVAHSLARYLARHPATARRIAHKLAVRFVSDDPPAALVDRLATVYLDSGTAVAPVLRALFASPEFAGSVGQKTRRPLEDVVATARALGAGGVPGGTGKAWWNLMWISRDAGQGPMAWAPPDGYPDVAAAWAAPGSVLIRWNMHAGLAGRWWSDGIVWPQLRAHLLPGGAASRDELVDRLVARLLPGLPVPPEHRSALVGFLGGPGPIRDGDLTWLFEIVVALVLDSPHWSTR